MDPKNPEGLRKSGTGKEGDSSQEGKIMAVHGPVVDIMFESEASLPSINEILKAQTYERQEVVLEVVEHKEGNIARCISLTPTYGLARNGIVTIFVCSEGRSSFGQGYKCFG